MQFSANGVGGTYLAQEGIFEFGLHEFLTDFIRQNNQLGSDIAEAYNF